MCPVSTLAGRFFPKKRVVLQKNLYMCPVSTLAGRFFPEKKPILVFSAPAGTFFLLKNNNLCPERPHRSPEAPGSDLGAHPASFLSIFDGRVVKY